MTKLSLSPVQPAGIGFAAAKLLLQEGATVIINGRTEAGVEQAMNRLKQQVPKASIKGMAADFGSKEEIDDLLQRLPDIDVLINNVGIYSATSFFEMPDSDWYRQFEVNVMSGVRLSRHCLPGMIDRNWGRILYISSECATLVPHDLIAYSMTKTALLAISRGLAQLTRGTDVTVNTIIPGSTLTEGAARLLDEIAERENKTVQQVEEEFFTQVRTNSLIQRFAKVEEIASTIAYLVSPLSSGTNGGAIKIDGGSMGGIF